MKVYLLILYYLIDGVEDTNVEVYSTKQAAQERMRAEYNNISEEYLEKIDKESICFHQPKDDYASISSVCAGDERYDTWRIVEQEVKGPKQYVLTEELYKKLSDWHEQCYEEHPNGDMVYTDGELLDGAISLYEQISELTRQQPKK